jgi:hypothetical protein
MSTFLLWTPCIKLWKPQEKPYTRNNEDWLTHSLADELVDKHYQSSTFSLKYQNNIKQMKAEHNWTVIVSTSTVFFSNTDVLCELGAQGRSMMIFLLLFPSAQFVVQIYHTFSFTTCFGLMGPSSGTFGLTITHFFLCYPPYIGQCLHIGSALLCKVFMWCPVLRNVLNIEYLKY